MAFPPKELSRPAAGWLALLLLFLAVVYSPVLRAGFCPWDDGIYTAENPLVRNGLSLRAIWGAFTSSWENNWCPVFWIFLAAQVSLAGISAGFFHATSLLLVLANTALLWRFLRAFGVSSLAAVAAAALFSLHPLRMEAVAWISSQKHLLAAAAALVSLILYQKSSGRISPGSLVAYAVSLMSSQAAVGLPAFVFFWELLAPIPDGRRLAWRRALGTTLPYLTLAAGAAAITLYVNWNAAAQVVPWFDHSWSHKILQACASLGWWVSRTFWPSGLAASYPWPPENLVWLVAGGVLSGLILTGCGGFLASRSRASAAGLAGFCACFVLVSGIISIPIPFTADRLTYVPFLFLALPMGVVLDATIRRGLRFPFVVVLGVSVLWGILSFRQAGFWRDEKTILARTLALYPGSVPAQINAAVVLGKEGNLAGALAEFQKIRASHSRIVSVWLNEMVLLRDLRRPVEVVESGALAVREIPKSPDLRLQYALALEAIGRDHDALGEFRQARELDPMSVQTTFQYARMLVRLGFYRDALPLLELLEFTMQGDPQFWEVRAAALEQSGNLPGAGRARENAERLRR